MKNFKKVTSLVLASFMALLAVACNVQTGVEEELPASEEEVKVDPDNGVFSAELDGLAEGEDGSGAVLQYFTIGGIPEDLEVVNDEINEYIEEKFGFTVDITFFAWDEYGSNMNTSINAGEAFDIAFGSSISGVSEFIMQDMFADISKLLPATPNLEALIPEDIWQGVTRADGEVFGVPAFKDSAATQYWVWDKALVEEYGIPYQDIITLDELTPALESAKEQNPDFYPMFLDRTGINSLNFEYEHLGGGVGVLFGTTEAVNMYEQPDVVNKFEILSDWFDRGLTNPDAETRDSKDADADMVFSAQGFDGAEVGWGANRGGEVVIQPRLGPMYTNGSIQGSYLVISRASQAKEEAIKFIEALNVDHYLRNLYAYGIEGTHYERVEGFDNTIAKIPEVSDRYNVPAYSQGQFMNLYSLEGSPEDQWTRVAEQNESAEASELLGFMFNPINVEAEIAAMNNVVNKYATSLNTGAGDVTSTLATMNEELYASGMQDVLDEVQLQIDAFLDGEVLTYDEVEETE